jgi:hypothetical protein
VVRRPGRRAGELRARAADRRRGLCGGRVHPFVSPATACYRVRWAKLLARVFGHQVLSCPTADTRVGSLPRSPSATSRPSCSPTPGCPLTCRRSRRPAPRRRPSCSPTTGPSRN